MTTPKLVTCVRPQPVKGRVDVRQWEAYGECREAREAAIYTRLTGLQRAVRVREATARKAIAASKL